MAFLLGAPNASVISISRIVLQILLCLLAILPARAGVGIWTQGSGTAGTAGTQSNALAFDTNGAVYAGSSPGVLKSTNGGTTWTTTLNNGLPSVLVTALTVDASGSIYAGTAGGVYKSSNGGISWVAVNSGLTYSGVLALAADLKGSVYAGTINGGVFKTTTGGASWAPVNSGLPAGALGTSVSALISDASGSVYAGTQLNGVFKSTNGGASWTSVNNGITASTSPSAFAIDTNNSLYAGTNLGVSKSTLGSTDWVAVNSGLPTGSAIGVRALTSDAGGSLYVGTTSGVFKSSNGGMSWVAMNCGLTSLRIFALKADASGVLYAGTDSGVFQYTVAASTPFSITGTAAGPNTALKLSASITVASADAGRTGNLYVVAYVSGPLFALTSNGWVPLNLAMIQSYTTATLGAHTITLLDGSLNVAVLKGVTIFVGYGTDANDMLNNGKYAQIYTIQ